MAHLYSEQNLKSKTKAELITIIQQLYEKSLANDVALINEQNKCNKLKSDNAKLKDKIVELNDAVNPSCTDDEYNVVSSIRDVISAQVDRAMEKAIQDHLEEWHYSREEED